MHAVVSWAYEVPWWTVLLFLAAYCAGIAGLVLGIVLWVKRKMRRGALR